ncbi:MAG: hypothetical protein ACW96U_04800, partial [Candidatus Heimdallarchaeaceae archaeon]
NKTSDIEIEKAKDYLLDSKKNIERLKSGKKPKRKLKFIINENRFLVFLISTLIVFSAFTPLFIPKPPPIIIDPFQDAVDATVYLIDSNFTNDNSLPFNSHTETTPTSELIILSSLANSFLKQTNFVSTTDNLLVKIQNIENILDNDSFVEYTNSSEILPIDKQFLGLYALLQANHATKGTEFSMELQNVYSVLTKTLNEYYSEDLEMMVKKGSNRSYLIDQAMSMFTIATFSLVTEVDFISGFSLFGILQNLIYSITENFYNSSTDRFYHEFDLTTNTSSTAANVETLIFLDLGLSKSDRRYPYEINFTYFTPYGLHQDIVSMKVDDDWIVHNYFIFDSNILLKNQALFTLCSYLLKLNNVGDELLNATLEEFITDEGFIENFSAQEVTCESCLYGLIAITSDKWAYIQNNREIIEVPEQSLYPHLIVSLLIVIVLIRKRRKKKL